MNKKKIMTVALAVALIAILACGTLAYFTADDAAQNKISIGNVAIELQEPSWVEEDAEKAYPTQVIPKDPQVENTGANACFIRVKVEGLDCLIDAELSENEVGLMFDEADGYNTSDWALKGDYYYYLEIVEPGDTTTALFDSIVIPADTVNGDPSVIYSIDISAEAVQAQGGPETLSADTIAAWFTTCGM